MLPGPTLPAAAAPDPLPAGAEAGPLRISVNEYREHVYASWPGQVVGNIYGLSYEFRFIDEPGPHRFLCGYGPSLQQVRLGRPRHQ